MDNNTKSSPLSVSQRLNWAGLTDKGPIRENNEDNLGVYDPGKGTPLPLVNQYEAQQTTSGLLFMVSDGVGGHQAGEEASRLAVEEFSSAVYRLLKGDEERRNSMRAALLKKASEQANGIVKQNASTSPDKKGMAATLSALWFIDKQVYLAQVGDSRVYRLRGGLIEMLSCDQSEIGRQLFNGLLTEREARRTPGRNVIDCALGVAAESFRPDTDWFEAHPGDLYLICSDGVSDGLPSETIQKIISSGLAASRPLEKIAQELLDRALEAYGRDNATVLLIEIAEKKKPTPPPFIADRPVIGKTKIPPVLSKRSKLLSPKLFVLIPTLCLIILTLFLFHERRAHSESLVKIQKLEDSLRSTLDSLIESRRMGESQQRDLLENFRRLERDADERINQFNARERDLVARLNQLNKQLAESEQNKNELNHQLRASRGNLNRLESVIQEQKKLIHKQDQELEALRRENAAYTSQLAELKKALKTEEADLEINQ